MNQETSRIQTTRMLRCRQCGCIQQPSNTVCKNCGEDLTLFGEYMKPTENTGTAEKESAGVRKKPSTAKGRKKTAGGKSFWKVTVPVLAVAAAAGINVWSNISKLDTQPTPQAPAISVTVPAETGLPAAEATIPSTSAAGTTIVGEADLSCFNQLAENAVPDLYYWSDGQATYRSEPSRSDVLYYHYKTDKSMVDSYVAMLQKHGFTLVDSYAYTYKSSFYSWGFICDALPGAKTVPLMYKDTPCHISLYYAGEEGQYTMIVSTDFQVCDTGLRYDGTTVDLRPSGPSAAAGLVQLADGSYQTSDGRLTASVGTAMVLRDGTVYYADAKYAQEDGDEVLRIENFYRNEGIYFQFPISSLLQGDVFTQRDLRRWRWHNLKSMKDLAGYMWGDKPMLAMPRNGVWLGPTFNEDVYKAQTIRVMAYDSGGIAVFYIYSAFLSGEPGAVEALCVVDTAQKSGTIGDATYIQVGNTATVKFTDYEFTPAWELYDWVILEGQDKISIVPGRDTCNVTGLAPGVATVQVTYDYGVEEPDVLTGIPRTVGRKKTKTYYFIVE